MMGRWAVGFCGFALLVLSGLAGAQQLLKPRMDFVYFGAADCPHCRAWEAYDLPRLMATSAFKEVHFHRVDKPIPAPVPSSAAFPAEIRQLRDAIAEKLPGSGSPMFAIAAENNIVAAWRGVAKTPEEILKIIADAQLSQMRVIPNPPAPVVAPAPAIPSPRARIPAPR
jgi:hypothetical protein